MGKYSFEEYIKKAEEQNKQISVGNHLFKNTDQYVYEIKTNRNVLGIEVSDVIEMAFMANEENKSLKEEEYIDANINIIKENAKVGPKLLANLIRKMAEVNPNRQEALFGNVNQALRGDGINVSVDYKHPEKLEEAFSKDGSTLKRMVYAIQNQFKSGTFKDIYKEATQQLRDSGDISVDAVKAPINLGEIPKENAYGFQTTKDRVKASDQKNKEEFTEEIIDQFTSKIDSINSVKSARSAAMLMGVSLRTDNPDESKKKPLDVTTVLNRAREGFDACIGKLSTKDQRAFVGEEGFIKGLRTIKELQTAHSTRPWYKRLAGVFGGEAGKETKLIDTLKQELHNSTGVTYDEIDGLLSYQGFQIANKAGEFLKDTKGKDRKLNIVSNEEFNRQIADEKKGEIFNKAISDANNELTQQSKEIKSLDNLALDTGAITTAKVSEGPSQAIDDPNKVVQVGK